MKYCSAETDTTVCDAVSLYLDITNQIELSCIMILQTMITILFLYIIYSISKGKIWQRVIGSQRRIIIAIMSLLLVTSALFFLNNVLEIQLYRDIYYQGKTLQQIKPLKNVYFVGTSLVPMIINNMYLLLCILWEEIMKKCLISSGKAINRTIGVAGALYNSVAITLCVLKCLEEPTDEKEPSNKGIIALHWVLLCFTLIPAFLIIFFLRRFNRNISYVDKRISNRKEFKYIVYVLAFVNIFRIIHSIFIAVVMQTEGDALNLVKLQKDPSTNCCERDHYIGYPIFVFFMVNILILLPLVLIHKTFIFQEDKEPKENIQSMLSEHSGHEEF